MATPRRADEVPPGKYHWLDNNGQRNGSHWILVETKGKPMWASYREPNKKPWPLISSQFVEPMPGTRNTKVLLCPKP